MNWNELLREKAVLISDGAWGTQLTKLGLQAGAAPELWNADNQRAVESIPRSYVEAGSDIVLTNTFGGSRWKLEKNGLGERTEELNRLGVEIARRASDGKALVFASVGPTGEFMAPLGLKTRKDFVRCFSEQIRALADAGADGIVIETMSDLGEARAALEAARDVSGLPVVVSMTFDTGVRGFATMMGVRPAQAAEELDKAGADIIGSNCGSGIESLVEIARIMRPVTNKPLWIKPNAGKPELVEGKTTFRETPEEMASEVPALIEAGANIIGGCCGTTPEHITRIAAAKETMIDTARRVSGRILDLLQDTL